MVSGAAFKTSHTFDMFWLGGAEMIKTNILIVDDDPKIRSLLRNVMEGEGYCVSEAETSAAALHQVETTSINLVMLDVRLGADNGIEVAREIRNTSRVPIIIVSGRNDVIDRVVGLEVGADDYITKPFHVREVVARVRSVLRRSEGQATTPKPTNLAKVKAPMESSEKYVFDGLTAFPERFQLLDRQGAECGLTSGDFKLLNVFLKRPKRVLSRDQLMDLTGGVDWSPLDRTIDNQVARLRKKIERDPSNPKVIKTIRGIGYSLACDVKVSQVTPVSNSA